MGFLDDKQIESYKLRAMDDLAEPILSAAVVGTTGAVTASYVATFVSLVGETTPCAIVTVTTAPTVLTAGNYVALTVSSIPAGVLSVKYYKLSTGQYRYLGESTETPYSYNDVGATVSPTIVAPVENTSGRPEWRAMLFHAGRYLQRQELMDMQWILQRADKDLGDSIYRNGDIVSGLNEQFVSGTTWSFTEGRIYLDGQIVTVPSGQVTLNGTGTEKVGLLIVPTVVPSSADAYLKNQDEGVDLAYAQAGADRLIYTFTWSVDEPTQIEIREFIDNEPLLVILPPEQTIVDKKIAQSVYDVSGSFVVENFPLEVVDHISDDEKLTLKIHPGKAYPNGVRTVTEATQTIHFDRTRDTASANNSGISLFSIPGGSVTTANAGDFAFGAGNLYAKFSVGSGAQHTVTFTGTMTAAQVATAIGATLNAVPVSDYDLVTCSVGSNYVNIRAADGKTLTVHAVANDAYTVLGLTAGTVATPIGTRVYEINDDYLATVSDLNYKTEIVEAVTYNASTDINELANSGVITILGASDNVADAHDRKWDYQEAVDFVKSGNNISFSGLGGAKPSGGATYHVSYHYNRNAIKGTRILVQVIDATVTKGAEDGSDAITVTGGTITKVSDGTTVTGIAAVKDVVSILRVNNSSGQSQDQYSLYSLDKKSTGLAHGISEVDWSEAGAQGGGSTGQPVTGATYYVSYLMWHHSTEGDFVSGDSYDIYEYIEELGTLNLRDCIDFRTTTTSLPVPGEDAGLDYTYYLARIDKLILIDTGSFSLVRGAPAINPPVPNTQTGTLEIALLSIPPYCYTKDDVTRISLQPMRTTQVGIQQLKEDIELLKYTTAVNNLEKEIVNHPSAADSVGIFTDALTGFGRMDLQFNKNSITHTAALDRANQCLLLPVDGEVKQIMVNDGESNNVIRRGNLLTLAYTPEVFDLQPYATSTVNCATDFTFEDYVGIMKLNPAVDMYLDVNQLPQLNVDFDNNLTPLLGALNGLLANNVNFG
jgi:hypothetical protein